MIRPHYYLYGIYGDIEVCSNYRYFRVARNLALMQVQEPAMVSHTRTIPDLYIILTYGGLPIL